MWINIQVSSKPCPTTLQEATQRVRCVRELQNRQKFTQKTLLSMQLILRSLLVCWNSNRHFQTIVLVSLNELPAYMWMGPEMKDLAMSKSSTGGHSTTSKRIQKLHWWLREVVEAATWTELNCKMATSLSLTPIFSFRPPSMDLVVAVVMLIKKSSLRNTLTALKVCLFRF